MSTQIRRSGGSAAAAAAPSRLALKHYRPATNTTISTTSTTPVDIDATNLAVTFTVPASGKVLVRLEGYAANAGNVNLHWSLREGAAVVPNSVGTSTALSAIYARRAWSTVISGLTPGEVKTWKWAHHTQSAASAANFYVGGTGGNDDFGTAIMTVEDAA